MNAMRVLKALGLWLLFLSTLSAGYVLDYRQKRLSAQKVGSCSRDTNEILKFKGGPEILLRSFRGADAMQRCNQWQHILYALERAGSGIAPRVLRIDGSRLSLTILPGKHVRIQDLRDGTLLPQVMAALERLRDGLRSIRSDLPIFTTLMYARQQLDAMEASDVKERLGHLLDAWERKFLLALQATKMGIVHGDLNARNMLWDGRKISLLDYEHCGRGYVMEDVARLSVYGALSNESDQVLLQRWFGGACGADKRRDVLEACKVLVRFAWVLGPASQLGVCDVRMAVDAINTPPVDAMWIARAAASIKKVSDAEVTRFLSVCVQEMRQLCEN